MTAGAETIRPDVTIPYLTADFYNSFFLWRHPGKTLSIFHYFRILGILYPPETPTARHVP
jgi:hypothetical protein